MCSLGNAAIVQIFPLFVTCQNFACLRVWNLWPAAFQLFHPPSYCDYRYNIWTLSRYILEFQIFSCNWLDFLLQSYFQGMFLELTFPRENLISTLNIENAINYLDLLDFPWRDSVRSEEIQEWSFHSYISCFKITKMY